MSTFDFANYQSLSNPLFAKRLHPYQPSEINHNYQSIPYQTVRRDVQKMLMRQFPTADEAPNELTLAIKQIQQQLNFQSSAGRQNFAKDNVQQQGSRIIHPQTKQYISQNQPFSINTTHLHKQTIKWNEIIVKDPFFPNKKENYFQIAGGFNSSYLPSQKKELISLFPPQRHPYIFVSNFFLLLSLYLSHQLNQAMLWTIFAGICLIYLMIAFGSSIGKGIFKAKTKENLESQLNGLKQHRGYFVFHIQCYHFSTLSAQTVNSASQRIISYKFSQIFNVSECIDESFNLQKVSLATSYAQIQTTKHFCFRNKDNEAKFIEAFNAFVDRNITDMHQQYYYTFQIDSLKEVKGLYSLRGSSIIIKCLFALSSVLALCFPFATWMQCQTARLQAKIVKDISL